MRYMLLVYGDPTADAPPETPPGAFPGWEAATQGMQAAGVLREGEGLHTAESATTVRFRGGEALLTDGPFAETKEQLLGYYVVEVADLDDALGWARRLPNVHWGAVEVRPVDAGPAAAR
jgi:hypothetical protein